MSPNVSHTLSLSLSHQFPRSIILRPDFLTPDHRVTGGAARPGALDVRIDFQQDTLHRGRM